MYAFIIAVPGSVILRLYRKSSTNHKVVKTEVGVARGGKELVGKSMWGVTVCFKYDLALTLGMVIVLHEIKKFRQQVTAGRTLTSHCL